MDALIDITSSTAMADVVSESVAQSAALCGDLTDDGVETPLSLLVGVEHV